jgi:hypothetical protein
VQLFNPSKRADPDRPHVPRQGETIRLELTAKYVLINHNAVPSATMVFGVLAWVSGRNHRL